MNITLRKANAIQQSILDVIRSIEIKTTVDLNEFQDVTAALTNAATELLKNDQRRTDLYIALYNIRALVGTANIMSEINLKLTQCAFYDKRIAQLEELIKSVEVTDRTIIDGKLEKIRNRPADGRHSLYSADIVTTGVLTRDQIDAFKQSLNTIKKQKQKLNDEILELNIKTEVPLTDETVGILTAEGIL